MNNGVIVAPRAYDVYWKSSNVFYANRISHIKLPISCPLSDDEVSNLQLILDRLPFLDAIITILSFFTRAWCLERTILNIQRRILIILLPHDKFISYDSSF